MSINNNKKYQKKILDLMKLVYSHRLQFNIPLGVPEYEQSQILSNKTIRYFMVYFEKNLNTTHPHSEETYLNQPEMNNLYSSDYQTSHTDVIGNHNNFMKIDLGEQPTPITNEYITSNGLNIENEGAQEELAIVDESVNDQKEFNNKDMTVFEKEVGQLFYALKDSANLKVNKYNLVVDTADCWTVGGDNTPFDINVKFGNPPSSTKISNNLYITKQFKNIYSLKINRVVIPSKMLSDYKYAFLYLCIKEYESNVITTGNIKNIFAKMYLNRNTRAEIGEFHTCDGFMHLVNTEGDVKKFKAPLMSLSKLSIYLVDPTGTYLTSVTSNAYTPYNYVQYMFELSTIENYIPHINSFPFNT